MQIVLLIGPAFDPPVLGPIGEVGDSVRVGIDGGRPDAMCFDARMGGQPRRTRPETGMIVRTSRSGQRFERVGALSTNGDIPMDGCSCHGRLSCDTRARLGPWG